MIEKETATLKPFIISKLKGLLEYPSEKPNRILSSLDGNSKWRKGWFAVILGYMELLTRESIITDKDLLLKIKSTKYSWVKGEFYNQSLVTIEDIQYADNLIKEVLAHLEKN